MSSVDVLNVDLDMILGQSQRKRSTKIVCTLGPSCWSVETLVQLIDAGMAIARFNFSHGDHQLHYACLQRLREACSQRPKKHVAVMLDTKGPEIRTGKLDPSLGGKLVLTKGDTIEVGTDYARLGTKEYLPCSYKSLPTSVKPGGRVLVADGSLLLEVVECREESIVARILNNATIGERKNMNLPGAYVDLPTLADQDVIDLRDFGVAHGVDFIAASFVRKAEDIRNIRAVLGEDGKDIKIIAKIENIEGLENFDDILKETDGIMVARGDLGMEIPLEKVFLAQKFMINKCNALGKPVITATQMFESMISNPRPTRAECSDVANAVLDGTDCVMLSGETANGQFPVDAVRAMANVCLEAESAVDYYKTFNRIRSLQKTGNYSITESLASSAVKIALDTNCPFIIVCTETGTTARLVSKYYPAVPIYALTRSPRVARQSEGFISNCTAIVVERKANDSETLIRSVIEEKVHSGKCKRGDPIVCLFGRNEGLAGATDMTRIFYA